jgi:hypothetical protein
MLEALVISFSLKHKKINKYPALLLEKIVAVYENLPEAINVILIPKKHLYIEH